MQVVLFSELENKEIKIKKPVSVGLGNFRLSISYLSHDLLIQTPTLYNPFEISRFDSIDLLINTPEKSKNEKNSFESKINFIDKLAKKMGKSYNLEFVSSIKSGIDTRFRLNVSRSCVVFNIGKQVIDLTNLRRKTMSKYIITPKYIWMNYVSEKYGVYWEIVQVKIMEHNYDIYMFIDDEEPKAKEIPEKYNKMIKMGIPKGAIENKMILDGLDPKLYFSSKNHENEKNKKMIPNPADLINAKSILKKSDVKNTHTNDFKDKYDLEIKGFKPPSIHELNKIRLGLNKISQ